MQCNVSYIRVGAIYTYVCEYMRYMHHVHCNRKIERQPLFNNNRKFDRKKTSAKSLPITHQSRHSRPDYWNIDSSATRKDDIILTDVMYEQ